MTELVPVSGLDPAQDALFRAWADVYRASDEAAMGRAASSWTADQQREMERSPDRRRLAWAAVEDGTVVAALRIVMPVHDNHRLCVVNLAVHPDHRRRGLGTLLLEHAEQAARDEGRSVLLAETEWLVDGRDEAGEEFLARHGYAAAQVVLRSSLPLPAHRGRLAGLLGRDGTDGYRMQTFWDGIPDELLDGRAELSRRMSTDAPLGALELEEEEWDAERVRNSYEVVAAMGRRVVDTFAVEEATGRLVGYTEVQVTPDLGVADEVVAYQQDTLVVREHRGHALGLRLKAANTLALMDEVPQATVVRTWNAEENGPMLAVNARIGYVRDAFLREWQKVLA
jgi:GNAT superfamily N-acetyltransferase